MTETAYRSLVRVLLLKTASDLNLIPHGPVDVFGSDKRTRDVTDDIRFITDKIPFNGERRRDLLQLRQVLEPILFQCLSILRDIDPHLLLQQLLVLEGTKKFSTEQSRQREAAALP